MAAEIVKSNTSGVTDTGEAIRIDFVVDESTVMAAMEELSRVTNNVRLSMARAINKTLTTAIVRMVRKLQGWVNLLQKDIKEGGYAHNMDRHPGIWKRNATTERLEGLIHISRARYPLSKFRGTRPTGPGWWPAGVRYSITRGATKTILTNKEEAYFIATMKSSHVGVFARAKPPRGPRRDKSQIPRGSTPKDWPPLRPIHQLWGPSLVGILLSHPEWLEELWQDIDELLEHYSMQQVEWELAKLRGAA